MARVSGEFGKHWVFVVDLGLRRNDNIFLKSVDDEIGEDNTKKEDQDDGDHSSGQGAVGLLLLVTLQRTVCKYIAL